MSALHFSLLCPVPPELVDISIQINDDEVTPTVGQSYTLTCSVTGVGGFTPTFQWRMDGDVISGETGPTLSLPPLRLSHAGQYICEATVATIPFIATQDVTIQGNLYSV